MELLTTAIILAASVVALIIVYYKWRYKYFEQKGIPFCKPVIPFGSFGDALLNKVSFGETVMKLYNTAKKYGYSEYGGFLLWRPVYLPIDPRIIKHILTVEFNTFSNRGLYYNKVSDPLSAHLLTLVLEEWKPLRAKLSPTFTSAKMKRMFPIINQCGGQLQKAMEKLLRLDQVINIRDIVGQFTADVIGSCAFGLDCNSFENPNSDFIKYSKMVLVDTSLKRLKGFLTFSFPELSKRIGVAITPKEITHFFMSIVKETVEYRETNNIVRNDFMQLLLNLKNDHPNVDGIPHLSLVDVTAQAFLFFVAGYETSSTTMMFCLYELSLNSNIQDNIRNEINAVLNEHGGRITYEAITQMKYMEQAMNETLRKYPPIPVLFRETATDYKLPGTKETLEKGTSVFISCLGLHYDPEFFPDPEMFDPDRFSDNNKHNINPYTYLPFGEGPRNCIGLRFGVTQVKAGLTYLLQNYRFSLNEKTQVPLKMDPSSFTPQPLGGVWLNVTKV